LALVRLSVDYEFSSRNWWEEGGQELWDAITQGFDGGVVLLEGDLARSWLEQARAVPGWNDGPEYAPHPIAEAPVDDEDAALY
jgi:hypothetical protein